MAIPPESQSPGAPYRLGVREPTQLMRDILDISKEFQLLMSRELSVNSTDLAAMELILMNHGMGPTELARKLGLSTAAVTTVVDRLVALGHATRSKHPHDGRAIIVQPTPEATLQAMSTIMPVVRAIESTLDDFDDSEQETITRYLLQVSHAYRQALPAEPR